MTLYELWKVTPRSFIFIRNTDGSAEEYNGDPRGTDELGKSVIVDIVATSYPMFKSVLEVKIA